MNPTNYHQNIIVMKNNLKLKFYSVCVPQEEMNRKKLIYALTLNSRIIKKKPIYPPAHTYTYTRQS